MRGTKAIVDLAAIRHNVACVRELVGGGVKIAAVVKADGYGHGLVPVSRAALQGGADLLAVALLEEGIELRGAGISAPVMVLEAFRADEAHLFVEHDLIPVVFTMGVVKALAREAGAKGKKAKVHIKLDTGMSRAGVSYREAVKFVRSVLEIPEVEIEGICTHLAASDEDRDFTNEQLSRFESVLAALDARGVRFKFIHAANSGAVISNPRAYYNMVRPGIMIYGLSPSSEMIGMVQLKPALKMVTEIAYIRSVPASTPIGYGCSFITARDSTIALLPVGYADGFDRRFSNRGHVLVRGKKVPIVGRVSMDLTVVDVTDVPDAAVGDEVVIIGEQGGQEISAHEVAELSGTICYEILSRIGKRVPREYVDCGSASYRKVR